MANNPAIVAPATSKKNDWWRRGVRTGVQFIAGGGLTVLFEQIVRDIPDQYDFYVLFLATGVVTLAQNYCEDQGWIPAVLKATSSSGDNPAPA